MKLNEITRKYLKSNGIKETFFAEWIGCDRTVVSRWLSGQKNIKKEHKKKVIEFISGEFIIPLDDLIGGGES